MCIGALHYIEEDLRHMSNAPLAALASAFKRAASGRQKDVWVKTSQKKPVTKDRKDKREE